MLAILLLMAISLLWGLVLETTILQQSTSRSLSSFSQLNFKHSERKFAIDKNGWEAHFLLMRSTTPYLFCRQFFSLFNHYQHNNTLWKLAVNPHFHNKLKFYYSFFFWLINFTILVTKEWYPKKDSFDSANHNDL